MSQFYDQASLVMVPSGYKSGKIYSQKPLSTSGELSFSRASNATRVNSSGLVEKVRTNLLFPSNDWVTLSISATATNNTTANPLDGATTAATLTGAGFFGKTVSASGIHTISVYLKAGTVNAARLNIYNGSTDIGVTFSLVDGSTSGEYGIIVNKGAVNVGNGWWRVYLSATCTSALYAQVHIDSAGTVFGYALQGETGDIATDYIATTSAAVSVGPVSGLPRLDYSGGASCPSLLLEPQRTNLATFSEQINATTVTLNAATLTENYFVSPDGYTNADKLTETATASQHRFIKTTSLGGSVDSSAYVISLFVKYAGRGKVQLSDNNQAINGLSKFNLETKSVISGTGKIEDYGNGWLRLSIYPIKDTSTTSSFFFNMLNEAGDPFYTGDGTSATAIYGCQIEAGAYATSYIPTYGTSATRTGDGGTTNIDSIINESEGVLFLDYTANDITSAYPVDFQLQLNGTNSVNGVTIFHQGSTPSVAVRSGTDQVFYAALTSTWVGARNKIALAYKANDFVVYQNGVKKAEDFSGNAPVSLNEIRISDGTRSFSIHQFLLFPTRLSNADLATLTTL
jgi:hypothetical protein